MRRLRMHSWMAQFSVLLKGERGLLFFPPVPNVFPSNSQIVLKCVQPKMFPIAPGFFIKWNFIFLVENLDSWDDLKHALYMYNTKMSNQFANELFYGSSIYHFIIEGCIIIGYQEIYVSMFFHCNGHNEWSHMVCPKFNSHVYKLKRKLGEHVCFYIATGGPKRCFIGGLPMFQK